VAEGWGLVEGRIVPGYSRSGRWHYFPSGRSLCGQVRVEQIDDLFGLVGDNDPASAKCKVCLRKRRALTA
jgi:hypothetical protein